jgi:hypothetical protein
MIRNGNNISTDIEEDTIKKMMRSA